MNYKMSASMICADQSDLKNAAIELDNENMDMLHIDVMDGSFVPRYGMYPEQLEAIRKYTNIPANIHMMVDNPEPFLEWFAKSGADYITVHGEPNKQIGRTIKMIKDLGLKAGICLNIGTPINTLDYLIDELDLVMLMAIHHGILGQSCWEGIYDKISNLREYSNRHVNDKLLIEIDGGVKPHTAPLMIKAGADILTCGTGTIFRPQEGTLKQTIYNFRNHMKKELS